MTSNRDSNEAEPFTKSILSYRLFKTNSDTATTATNATDVRIIVRDDRCLIAASTKDDCCLVLDVRLAVFCDLGSGTGSGSVSGLKPVAWAFSFLPAEDKSSLGRFFTSRYPV
jgi:hypothetical protein